MNEAIPKFVSQYAVETNTDIIHLMDMEEDILKMIKIHKEVREITKDDTMTYLSHHQYKHNKRKEFNRGSKLIDSLHLMFIFIMFLILFILLMALLQDIILAFYFICVIFIGLIVFILIFCGCGERRLCYVNYTNPEHAILYQHSKRLFHIIVNS